MSRQHATPLLLGDAPGDAVPLTPLSLSGDDGLRINEAYVRDLIHANPACLPITEIDPLFVGPVPICTELETRAGRIDNFMVTPSGLPVLVECKLWRNPEGRREVVGQILDYAKELTRWSSSDLQREVSRRLKRPGNVMLERLRAEGHDIDEIDFNDALTFNLRRGRFLLLIVGDGIREGVEAIAEYLQVHAGLHFSLGLVEMPIYATSDGERLVVPRVLARTILITREVVTAPDGFAVADAGMGIGDLDESLDEATLSRRTFLRDLISAPLALDPDQPNPRVSDKGWLFLYLPAPASSCWVSILVKDSRKEVGVRLTSNANTIGEAAIRQVVQDWPSIREKIGGHPVLREQSPGRFVVEELLSVNRNGSIEERDLALQWLRGRLRDFVAVFRPAVRDAVQELME